MRERGGDGRLAASFTFIRWGRRGVGEGLKRGYKGERREGPVRGVTEGLERRAESGQRE